MNKNRLAINRQSVGLQTNGYMTVEKWFITKLA